MLRAAHQLFDGDPKILVDEPIVRFLGNAAVAHLHARRDELFTRGSLGLRAHVLLRSRFAEDRLAEAHSRAVRQYVILGAGLDTFAYRQPAWAADLRVIEVDHPGSQNEKRAQIEKVGIEAPRNVSYAAIDFENTTLADGLRANGVDLSAPTFFSWLGVTMYLTEEAVDAVLRTVAAFPKSSEIVFTFAQPRSPADSPEWSALAEQAAAVGEPWLSYFEPAQLEAKLGSFGFSNIDFLTPAIAEQRYFAGRTDALRTPRRTSIVSAIV